MAIQTKMNRRDKMLIYICVILVIVAGTYIFIISPMLDEKAKLEETLLTKTEQADNILNNQSMLEISNGMYEEIMSDYDKSIVGYYVMTPAEDIDEFLTSALKSNNLYPEMLSINEETDSDEIGPVPYNYVLEGMEEAFVTEPVIAVKETEVSLNCSGTMQNVKNYIDFLHSTDGIYITSVSVSAAEIIMPDTVSALSLALDAPSLDKDNVSVNAEISAVFYMHDEDYEAEDISIVEPEENQDNSEEAEEE